MTSAFGIEHIWKGVNPFVKPAKLPRVMDEVFQAHHKQIADSYRQVTLKPPQPRAKAAPTLKQKTKKPKEPSKRKTAAVGLATGAVGGTAIAGGGLAYQKKKQKTKVAKSAFGVEHVSKLAARADQVTRQTKAGPVKKPKGKLKRISVGAVNASHQFGGAGPTPLTVAARSVTPLRTLLHG